MKYLRFANSSMNLRGREGISLLAGISLSLILFAILRGPLILWNQNGTAIVPAGSMLLAGGSAVLIFSLLGYRLGWRELIRSPAAAVSGLTLVVMSDWLNFRFNLFQGPSIRGELLVAGLFAALLLRAGVGGAIPVIAACFPILMIFTYLDEARGNMLFSDDHTAVFYRLALLLENFPHIPFFNPLWNAGLDARDFFATGILNFYFLFYPLLSFFGADASYSYLVGAAVFLLVPLMTFFAAQLHGLRKDAAFLAIGLSLSSSLLWYRWCLKYGAMGFVISAALVPLNLAFAARILRGESLKGWQWIVFLVTLSLMGFWILSLAVFLPLAVFVLAFRRDLFRSNRVRGFLAAFLLLNVPWILIFLDSSRVFEFVRIKAPSMEQQYEEAAAREEGGGPVEAKEIHIPASVKGKAKPVSAKGVTKALRSFATNSNPLLLFWAVPGLFALPFADSRKVLSLTGAWLLVLGVIAAPTLPQLELERMLVILAIIFVVPVASSLSESIAACRDAGWPRIFATALPLAFLLVSGPVVAGIIRNRSMEHYAWADSTVPALVSVIQQEGGDGRVLFSGFVLHELSQGHLAPLAYWTKRPLVASSPFHNRWTYTNVVPAYFMDRGPDGIEEYLDLMNVTGVFAHERNWRQYFISRPERYAPVWAGGKFQFFRRNMDASGYFLKGSGEVREQSSHHLVLRVDSESAVIKFNYFPFLRSSSCVLSPYSAGGDLTLIQLSGCAPGTSITIEAVNALQRIRS